MKALKNFLTELKKATTEETSLLSSVTDGFVNKFKNIKPTITKVNCDCCCDSKSPFDMDRDDGKDKSKKKKKRRTGTKGRTKGITKSSSKLSKVSSAVSKASSKVGSILGKAKDFIGTKGLIESAKAIGKKALTKVGGAGIASMLGP